MRLLSIYEQITIISELVKLMQEESELEANLNYTVRCYLSWRDIKLESHMGELRLREENGDLTKCRVEWH